MRYLRLTDDTYINADAVGIATWGSYSQKFCIKKRKYWYSREIVCVDPVNDIWETYDEKLLNVIGECEKLPEDGVLQNQEESDAFASWCMAESLPEKSCMI